MYTRKYGVWCAVSGGVTGHREAWLKEADKVLEFDNYEQARATAKDLQDRKKDHPYAVFAYVPRPLCES